MTKSVATALQEALVSLREGRSESARLDAELLLGHVLGVDRTTVLAHPEAPVSDGQLAAYRAAVTRRARGEPVAYVRGMKEFYGRAFSVDPRALIPRPETELLVDLALARTREVLAGAPRAAAAAPFRVWDVGTGSGAIAVSLAATLRRHGYGAFVRLLATDVSPDALAVAVENAVGQGVADVIDFAVADLLEVADASAERLDLIVANLPYVPSGIVPTLPVAASFEPPLALDGGVDGLDVIRRLLPGLPRVLAHDGLALVEFGSDQAQRLVREVETSLPNWTRRVHRDLAGHPRVVALAAPGVRSAILAEGDERTTDATPAAPRGS